jgi:hypothetical protein
LILQVQISSKTMCERFLHTLPPFLVSMQERTILSGGDFSVNQQSMDRLQVESIWYS